MNAKSGSKLAPKTGKSIRAEVSPELEEVAAQIGVFIEYFGFKNVHGKIWAHLYVAASPLDAGDLIETLGVSKALISMSLSDLMDYDVIQIAGKSERGTITYKANPNVVTVVMGVLRKRERKLLSRIAGATKVLESRRTLPGLNPERLKSLHEMVLTAEESLDTILQLGEVSFEDFQKFDEDPAPSSN